VVDEVAGNAARAQLGAQAAGAIAAGPPSLHPPVGEGGVVQVAASHELGDQRGGQLWGSTAADKPPGEVGLGPRTARQQVRGDPTDGRRGERRARRGRPGYFFLAKGLPPGEVVPGGGGTPAMGFFCSPSNVISPVEKMPRTLRSKSSALVAASRAVS
jgi:hypothetical protein